MSVLETFLILFESNAGEVKKEAVAAKLVTDALERSIISNDKAAQNLKGGFGALARELGAFVGTLFAVSTITRGLFSAVNFADKLDEASQALDISVESLSAWGDAVQLAGGTSEGFRDTVSNLSGALAQMDVTGKSRVAPFFKELGINIQDSSGKVKAAIPLLLEVAEAFEGMSKQQSIGFGRKLGLDMGTIMLLQQGRRGVDEIIRKQKELGVVTTEQARIANEFNDTIDQMKFALRGVFLELAGFALPGIMKFIEVMAKAGGVARENGKLIVSTIIAISAAILYRLTPALAAAGWSLLRIPVLAFAASVSMLGFSGALGVAAASAWAFMAPILGVIAVVGLLALIIEDLWSLFEGGPSLIGDIAEAIINWLAGAFQFLIDKVEYLKNLLSFDSIKGALTGGSMELSAANASGIGSVSSNTIMSGAKTSSKNVNIGEVKIQTQATDADGIARGIDKGLQRELRQASDNFDDGIRG